MLRLIAVSLLALTAFAGTAEARRHKSNDTPSRFAPVNDCSYAGYYGPIAACGQDTRYLARAGRTERFRHRSHHEARNRVFSPVASFADRTLGVPGRFVRGRLICAVNVGVALAERGIKGTGSALAKSYLTWGRASGPVPGAVAVFNRRGGGHVSIVDHIDANGSVYYLHPSSRRQAWQIGPYNRRPIAYRVAG